MRIGNRRLVFRKDRLLTLTIHLLIVLALMSTLGVVHLFENPIVMGAIFLLYYDLWVRK